MKEQEVISPKVNVVEKLKQTQKSFTFEYPTAENPLYSVAVVIGENTRTRTDTKIDTSTKRIVQINHSTTDDFLINVSWPRTITTSDLAEIRYTNVPEESYLVKQEQTLPDKTKAQVATFYDSAGNSKEFSITLLPNSKPIHPKVTGMEFPNTMRKVQLERFATAVDIFEADPLGFIKANTTGDLPLYTHHSDQVSTESFEQKIADFTLQSLAMVDTEKKLTKEQCAYLFEFLREKSLHILDVPANREEIMTQQRMGVLDQSLQNLIAYTLSTLFYNYEMSTQKLTPFKVVFIPEPWNYSNLKVAVKNLVDESNNPVPASSLTLPTGERIKYRNQVFYLGKDEANWRIAAGFLTGNPSAQLINIAKKIDTKSLKPLLLTQDHEDWSNVIRYHGSVINGFTNYPDILRDKR